MSHNLFLGMTACILFFKMHSYTSYNLDAREEYLAKKSDDREVAVHNYPQNVLMNSKAVDLPVQLHVLLAAPQLRVQLDLSNSPQASGALPGAQGASLLLLFCGVGPDGVVEGVSADEQLHLALH